MLFAVKTGSRWRIPERPDPWIFHSETEVVQLAIERRVQFSLSSQRFLVTFFSYFWRFGLTEGDVLEAKPVVGLSGQVGLVFTKKDAAEPRASPGSRGLGRHHVSISTTSACISCMFVKIWGAVPKLHPPFLFLFGIQQRAKTSKLLAEIEKYTIRPRDSDTAHWKYLRVWLSKIRHLQGCFCAVNNSPNITIILLQKGVTHPSTPSWPMELRNGHCHHSKTMLWGHRARTKHYQNCGSVAEASRLVSWFVQTVPIGFLLPQQKGSNASQVAWNVLRLSGHICSHVGW